jgi:hypothetical protein
VHHLQYVLGHASLQQTSTYLDTTPQGLHESMRNLSNPASLASSLQVTSTRSPRPSRKQGPARDGNSSSHLREKLAGSTGLGPETLI